MDPKLCFHLSNHRLTRSNATCCDELRSRASVTNGFNKSGSLAIGQFSVSAGFWRVLIAGDGQLKIEFGFFLKLIN